VIITDKITYLFKKIWIQIIIFHNLVQQTFLSYTTMQKTSNIAYTRKCCVCNKQLFGRSDKVFCDIHCKNKYHKEVRNHTQSVATNNIKILNRNYVILIQLLGIKGKKITINKLALQELKFDFSTVSGIENTKWGVKMKVYEISWYFAGKDNVVIFQNNDQRLLSPYVYKRWEMHWQAKQTQSPIALDNYS